MATKTRIIKDPVPGQTYLEITLSESPKIVLEVFYEIEAKLTRDGFWHDGSWEPAEIDGIVKPTGANLMIAADDWSNDLDEVTGYKEMADAPAILQAIEKVHRPDAEALGFGRSDLAEMLRDMEE
jgi:hypothetical protein